MHRWLTFFLCFFVFQIALISSALAETSEGICLVPAAEAAEDPAGNLTEPQKIQRLLKYTSNSDYTFIRNGEEHSGKEAARHLRLKYGFARDQIKTAEQFVEYLASSSSTTGEPYWIKTQTGKYPARDVMFNELRRMESSSAAGHRFR